MKKVQIDYELFRKLIFYHLGSDDQYEEDIRNGLEDKLDALVRHELYTKYKTAPSEEESSFLELAGSSTALSVCKTDRAILSNRNSIRCFCLLCVLLTSYMRPTPLCR